MTYFSRRSTVVSTPISAPVVVEDLAVLSQVAGGFGPNGGWTAPTAEVLPRVQSGPNGGWIILPSGPNGGW